RRATGITAVRSGAASRGVTPCRRVPGGVSSTGVVSESESVSPGGVLAGGGVLSKGGVLSEGGVLLNCGVAPGGGPRHAKAPPRERVADGSRCRGFPLPRYALSRFVRIWYATSGKRGGHVPPPAVRRAPPCTRRRAR